MGVNYKKALDNIRKNIIEPLKSQHEVDIYLVTYENPKLTELATDFGACSVNFFNMAQNNQTSLVIKGLEIIRDTNVRYDVIIITRFDVELKENINNMSIEWCKFNFTFRETASLWQVQRRIGDTFTIFPWNHLGTMLSSLYNNRQPEHMHLIYDYIVNEIEAHNIHFMHDECFDSAQNNPIYRIIRGCHA